MPIKSTINCLSLLPRMIDDARTGLTPAPIYKICVDKWLT